MRSVLRVMEWIESVLMETIARYTWRFMTVGRLRHILLRKTEADAFLVKGLLGTIWQIFHLKSWTNFLGESEGFYWFTPRKFCNFLWTSICILFLFLSDETRKKWYTKYHRHCRIAKTIIQKIRAIFSKENVRSSIDDLWGLLQKICEIFSKRDICEIFSKKFWETFNKTFPSLSFWTRIQLRANRYPIRCAHLYCLVARVKGNPLWNDSISYKRTRFRVIFSPGQGFMKLS